MLNNYSDNIMSRFLESIATLWNSAVKYQIFVILVAIGLLTTLPLLVARLGANGNVIINITIFCMVAVAGFLLFRLKGSQLAAFTFAVALVFRLCLVFAFGHPSPYLCNDERVQTYKWIRHYDSALLQADEFFYAYMAQAYKDMTSSEFINLPELAENEQRASFLMSRIFGFFGDEFAWLRIIGAFLGAFAAAIICLAAQKLFSQKTCSIVSLLAALAPQTAFYSVRFLKEIWVIFAVSLLVFGFTVIIRNKKLFLAILSITAAIIILFWIRFEYGLIFTASIPIAICFRRKSDPAAKTIAILSVIIFGAAVLIWQGNQLARRTEGWLNKYTITKKEQSGRLETMDKVYKSRGLLRLLNIPLTVLNPPPKNLHHIFTLENELYDVVLQTDIWQWWLSLPFLIIGSTIIISKRTDFLVFLTPYIMVIAISALVLGGLLPALYRYRDTLAPIAFIIVGAGIESFITERKLWGNIVILSVCVLFVSLTVYFYLVL
ncbi:MAG: hypothetical protein PHP01_03545 [Phycisphaerae bacterium]|nr:hypothetical protein [Phycisphaerae bacterium]